LPPTSASNNTLTTGDQSPNSRGLSSTSSGAKDISLQATCQTNQTNQNRLTLGYDITKSDHDAGSIGHNIAGYNRLKRSSDDRPTLYNSETSTASTLGENSRLEMSNGQKISATPDPKPPCDYNQGTDVLTNKDQDNRQKAYNNGKTELTNVITNKDQDSSKKAYNNGNTELTITKVFENSTMKNGCIGSHHYNNYSW